MKSLRTALSVESRNPFQIPFVRFAAQFIRQCRHVFFRQQRRLLRPRSRTEGERRPARYSHSQRFFPVHNSPRRRIRDSELIPICAHWYNTFSEILSFPPQSFAPSPPLHTCHDSASNPIKINSYKDFSHNSFRMNKYENSLR
jgi:UDP:flavonoid glycosyltransferase YjiC (YdhE family)